MLKDLEAVKPSQLCVLNSKWELDIACLFYQLSQLPGFWKYSKKSPKTKCSSFWQGASVLGIETWGGAVKVALAGAPAAGRPVPVMFLPPHNYCVTYGVAHHP